MLTEQEMKKFRAHMMAHTHEMVVFSLKETDGIVQRLALKSGQIPEVIGRN